MMECKDDKNKQLSEICFIYDTEKYCFIYFIWQYEYTC